MREINAEILNEIVHDNTYQISRIQPATHAQKQISSTVFNILQDVQKTLAKLDKLLSNQEINELINDAANKLGFEIASFERDQILSLLETDKKPFGILQSLVEDKRITDIVITDYAKISVQQGRKNYNTDLTFPSCEAYEAFVERLLKKGGATISTKKPIADGMIGSFARLHAVHKSLCETGPYLTIRLNRFSEVCADDLIKSGLAPKEIFDYLKGIITKGETILVAGEVATGKTTLTRALAAAIPLDESILVIEDTPEIKLSHPFVRYIHTRESNSEGAGRVAPSECIKAGMRMAMNRIIFGEMRDAEAAESFVDVCASGHPGLSTIHAKSIPEALTRLELFLGRVQKGVAADVIQRQISTAVQIIVHIDICQETGCRRIMNIKEIGNVADGVLRQKDIFKYEIRNGTPSWRVMCRASNFKDYLESQENPLYFSNFPTILTLAV